MPEKNRAPFTPKKIDRIILGSLWGVLFLPSAFFAVIAVGFSSDSPVTGNSLDSFLLITLLLPLILLASCVAELCTAIGVYSKVKDLIALLFTVLPTAYIVGFLLSFFLL